MPDPPPQPRPPRRAAAAAAATLALAVGIGLWGVRIGQTRVLHLLNATGTSARVQLPDARWVEVPAGERVEAVLGEGDHRLHVETGDKVLEVRALMRTDFAERFTRQPLFVLNVDGAGLLVREETVYGGVDLEAGPDEILAETFLALDHVDFPFQPFPDRAPRQGIAVRLSWLRGTAAEIADALPPGSPQALELLERALLADPDDERTLATWSRRVRRGADGERELSVLAAGIELRPLRLSWHRLYQDALRRRGRWDELERTYSELLAEAPNDADRLYLLGRLGARAGDAIRLYRRATASDPQHHAAWRGLAVQWAGQGQWEAAWEACARAGDAPDPDLDELRFQLRVARGDLRPLSADLLNAQRERPLDPNLLRQRLEVLVALADPQAASQALRAYAKQLRRDLPDDPQQLGLLSQLWLGGLQGEAEQVLEASRGLRDEGRRASLQVRALAELGRLDQASELLGDTGDPWRTLQLALAALAHGQEAASWIARAQAQAEAGSPREQVLGEVLRSGEGLDQVVAPALERATLAAVLAAQHPHRAAELIAEAERLTRRPTFPARLIRLATERLR